MSGLRFSEASEWMGVRSRAAHGFTAEEPDAWVVGAVDFDGLIRKLLSGIVPPEQMDEVLEGTWNAAANAMYAVRHSPTLPGAVGSLAVALAQTLATGIKMQEAE